MLHNQTANYVAREFEAPQSCLKFSRVLFLICPTGFYCREDRCQSFFSFELIPSMRAPMEECEAAAGLQDIGVQHLILDAPALGISGGRLLEAIRDFNPDLVILGVTFGSLVADAEWAIQIKKLLPQSPIGLRGAPAYTLARQILTQNMSVDFCVRGDYEISLTELCQHGLEDAAGISYRKADGSIEENRSRLVENLDHLPISDRSTLDLNRYKVRGLNQPQATIHVQRGCPFPCSYCLVHTVSGNTARHRSPESIAEEIRKLIKQNIRYYYFRAETFSLNRKWALAVAKTLQERCPGIRWVTTTRVECVDQELLYEFKKGGCYGISFGIDVASPQIGRQVNKAPKLEIAKRVMKECSRAGIISLGYFMIGFPWENRDTLLQTKNFVLNAKPDLITIHYAHPYPGTPYYDLVKQLNLNVCSLKAQAEPAFIPPQLKAGELQTFGKRLLLKHYSRPSVLLSIMRKIVPLKIESYKRLLE